MFRRSFASFCIAVVAVSAGGCRRHKTPAPASAVTPAKHVEDKAPLGPPLETADVTAQKIFERTASTGMVIAIVRDGDVWVKGYGRTGPGSNDVPDGDSLIRLCSLTKILATDLLGKLLEEKKISLDDPLQKYAPKDSTVPTMTARGPALRPMTIEDLATHTAGLPREIAYPPQGMAHFTFPDFDYRWQWLPQARLKTSPGFAAHYSNISFDLLSDAISAAAGEDYAKLFHERTAEPLGMVDTTLTPTEEQCSRLLGGAREPQECVDTQAAQGSGGMYSTANDMVRFLKYLLKLPGVPAQNGLSTEIVLDPANLKWMQGLGHAGVPTGLGLGWIEINKQYGESRIVEKTGGGAGYQTYIALDPARHAGIFIARTDSRGRAATNMFRDANDLLLTMAGLPPVPVDPDDPERERTGEELEEAKEAAVKPLHGRGAGHHAVAKPAAKRERAAKSTHATAKPARTAAKPTHTAVKPSHTAAKPAPKHRVHR